MEILSIFSKDVRLVFTKNTLCRQFEKIVAYRTEGKCKWVDNSLKKIPSA